MNHDGDSDVPDEDKAPDRVDQPETNPEESETLSASPDEHRQSDSDEEDVEGPEPEGMPTSDPKKPREALNRLVNLSEGGDFNRRFGFDRINALFQPPQNLLDTSALIGAFQPPTNEQAWFQAILPNLGLTDGWPTTKIAARLGKQMSDAWSADFTDLFARHLPDFSGLVEKLDRLQETLLPPNWQNYDIEIPENLDDLVLKEALPLAWVPDSETLRQIFQAINPGARREVLLQRSQAVIESCKGVLASVEGEAEREWADFASFAADSLANGHHQVSQALSANVLDTAMQTLLPDPNERRHLTSANHRAETLDELDMGYRIGLALGAAGASYIQFFVKNGDEIPNDFSRHASAHGVSHRQYTPLNALLALMHATAVIKTIDAELRDDEETTSEATPAPN